MYVEGSFHLTACPLAVVVAHTSKALLKPHHNTLLILTEHVHQVYWSEFFYPLAVNEAAVMLSLSHLVSEACCVVASLWAFVA